MSIPAGYFDSIEEAKSFVADFGVAAVVRGYDPEADEQKRVRVVRSLLSDFAGADDIRARISKEDPELFRLLENHPEYWRLLYSEAAN